MSGSVDHDLIQRLAATRFAEHVDPEILEAICRCARRCFLPEGTVLFPEGAEIGYAYVVLRGRIALEMHVPRRGNVRLMTLGAGELVGWSGLVGSGRATASAITVEDSDLIEFSVDDLRCLCERDPRIGYVLMQRTAQALASRLLATRLQMLDVYADVEPVRRVQNS